MLLKLDRLGWGNSELFLEINHRGLYRYILLIKYGPRVLVCRICYSSDGGQGRDVCRSVCVASEGFPQATPHTFILGSI